MLPLHVTLSYYKRPEIREAMVQQCRGKEVAVKYGDGFGKRPDTLVYPTDVLEFAKQRATSFHVSEETWTNPLQLATGLRKQELDQLRVGWDLVLDIDFPVWDATLRIAEALVEQLKKEGVPTEAITAKFSGNKGFHIAVPYEAFPDAITDDDGNENLTSDLFPDGVRSIVEYLVHQVDGPDNNYALSEELVQAFGDELQDMLTEVCADCGKKAPGAYVEGNEFVCEYCEWRGRADDEYLECPKCKELGRSTILRPMAADLRACEKCDSTRFRRRIDLAIDTVLVSSRHMYRLVYSLHEKSGLASIPVDPDTIGSFDRESAKPENVTTDIPFLDRDVPQDCARPLLERGLAFQPPDREERRSFEEVEWVGDAAPEEVFPPPIKKMLAGMRDGRKRALFVLTNFLSSVGWSPEMIEARLREWNEANPEPLRENAVEQHIRYYKQKQQTVLPPNFDNEMYYKDLGVLEHDELSRRVKNPVQYVRLKMKQIPRK